MWVKKMEEKRPCDVGFGWCCHDDLDENSIKDCFEYAKEIGFMYAGVFFEVSDLSVKITVCFGEEERKNNLLIESLDDSKLKMLCDSIVFAKKLLEKFDADAMKNRKLYVTVKELNVVFSKIILAIDNNSNEEYKVYSRELQDKLKTMRSKMMKEEFEKLIGKCIDDDTYENVVEFVYMSFFNMGKNELAAMYVEDEKLFKDGYELARELRDIHEARDKFMFACMNKADDMLCEYCREKEEEYMARVKAKYGNR